MNYREALEYIEQLNTKGIALGLERISVLMDLLGNPQNDVQCIHVAGTNGKGSVCAFMDSVMRHAGLRVGRYISPTLYDYLERFQINGAYIDAQEFAEILTQVRTACEAMAQRNLEVPTVFEVETAAAFLYFKKQQCDYVLLEVGMGGRLDSTNVIARPAVSVITSISMDHTGMLGNTLGEIAYEKTGIIKPGCSVVLAPQDPEAMDVLCAQCESLDIVPQIVRLDRLCSKSWSLMGQRFSYGRWQNLFIPLVGYYQQINAAVALEALCILQQNEPALTEDVIRDGLAQAKWPGRFEAVLNRPLFIVDGAHNPAGAQALADTVAHMQEHLQGKLWLLMGVFRDKDYETIGRIMSQYSDTLICFQPPGERGLEAMVLAEVMKPYYATIIIKETAEDAVQCVLARASEEDMILSFGSLSTIKAVEDAVHAWGGSGMNETAKGNTKRINAILADEQFRYGLARITELEQERIFCCHGLEHLLDVARIAWIMVLEQNLPLEKDIVYGAALLHDLGRYRQYEENIPHHQASVVLAGEILPNAGYTDAETAQIADAIGQHGTEPQSQGQLARILYDADKLSRNCFQCKAQAECKWKEEKRNRTIRH